MHAQTRTGITSFSPFVVEDETDKELAVEYLTFEAERISPDKVVLNWSTVREDNNKGFEVQRALALDVDFETVWLKGVGNSNTVQFYEYKDLNSYEGTSYYRLKEIDRDGHFLFCSKGCGRKSAKTQKC